MNKQTTYNNAVTSIRPTDNRLHFGHWIGNISSLIKYQDEKCCFFIFADLQMQNMISNEITDDSIRNNMMSMMRQMINLGVNPEKVTFAIESVIKREQLCNIIILSDYLTNTRLNRLPLFKQSQTYKMSLSLFPILQAVDFLITQSDVAFSNNDNKPFIELINELFKKANTKKGCNFPHIDLITGIVDFLCGHDGRKMSKSHNNCIFLDDTYEEIKRKVNKMYTDPNRICGTEKGDTNNNVVFKCLKAFCQSEHYEFISQQYTNGEISDTYTKEYLSDLMCKIAQKSQNNSTSFSDNELWDMLLQGTNKLKANNKYIKYNIYHYE
jgi:tryptophanyl-tRNA synthetase